MEYELSIDNYTVNLSLDCSFGDEEFLINGYDIVKVLYRCDLSEEGGGITIHTFNKDLYAQFNNMHCSEIKEALDENALEISELYNQHKKETSY